MYTHDAYYGVVPEGTDKWRTMKASDDIYDISVYDVKDTEEERVFGNVLYREEEQIPPTLEERMLDEYLEMGVYSHLGMSFDVYIKQNKASLDLINKSLSKYKERIKDMRDDMSDLDMSKLLKGDM